MFARFGGWAAGACMLACPFDPTAAEPASRDHLRRILYFSGADLSSVSFFGWAGADIPLKSRDLSGPVLRLTGGTGGYDYASEHLERRIHGDVTLGEVVAGWRHLRPGFVVTALAGIEVEDHRLDAEDPENEVSGTGVGARFLGELWWEPSADRRLEASLAYGTAFDFYRMRIAGGLNVWHGIFAGPEIELFGNAGSDQRRAGLFIQNLAIRGLRFKTSFGALDDGDGTGAYGRLGVDGRF